ncbi:MAG: lactate utilization protein C [Humibacillus sp.]|nr:lactate utilization protein C [Humibacillus sp.]MDN5779321.1 lactate utilization protein C [Humibacillus sp.]
MNAREEILGWVRAATADVTDPIGARGATPVVEIPSPGTAETLRFFAENVADYRATVLECDAAHVGERVAEGFAAAGCHRVVVPSGLDPAWTSALGQDVVAVPEAQAGSHGQLESVDGVVTAAAVGIATTGTIVLDHRADQGRRELTLVPDVHVCVVRADQVVHDVPEAVARLRPGADGARPQTWISGPSATSDIELQRVEGVHGPRTLVVIIVTG